MFTRRTFLWSSAAALLASRANRATAEPAQADAQLPPSLAALTSMRDRAKPITNDARRARIEKARRLMAQHKIDAIMLTQGTSLVYFTNIHWGGGERLTACLIPAKGEPFFVCPAFEEDRAREQIARGPFGSGKADVRVWNEDESPYALVAGGLKDRGVATGVLGIEETTKHVWSDSVAQAAPQLKLTSASPVVAGCRMIKEPAEIDLMRLASQVTLKAYEAAYRALQPGMTQDTVADLRAGAAREAEPRVRALDQVGHGVLRHPRLQRAVGRVVGLERHLRREPHQIDLGGFLDHPAAGDDGRGAGQLQLRRGLGDAVAPHVLGRLLDAKHSGGDAAVFETAGDEGVRALVFVPHPHVRRAAAEWSSRDLLAGAVFLEGGADEERFPLGGDQAGGEAFAAAPVDVGEIHQRCPLGQHDRVDAVLRHEPPRLLDARAPGLVRDRLRPIAHRRERGQRRRKLRVGLNRLGARAGGAARDQRGGRGPEEAATTEHQNLPAVRA